MSSDLLNRKKNLESRTFMMMFRILIIFGLPAILGYFVGKWVDTRFDIRPTGTLLVLLVTFVFSWTVTIRMYLTLDKERKEIEALEEAAADAEEAMAAKEEEAANAEATVAKGAKNNE